VRVTCEHPGVFRVYLNGRDTGRNCPTVLSVGYGRNNVRVLLPQKKRTAFKYFRAIAGKVVEVHFPY
jgi:hypothetical protein